MTTGARETGQFPSVVPAHRSYRRLHRTTGPAVAQAMALLLVVEGVLIAEIDSISSLVARVSRFLVPPLTPPVSIVTNSYFGIKMKVLSLVLPSSTYWTQIVWLAAGTVTLMTVVFVRKIPIPIRVTVGFIAILVCISAYCAVAFGPPGFDGYEASRLYLRTEILLWLLLPVLLTAASIALPFSFVERTSLLIGCVVVDVGFSIIRYSFFIWAIGSVGPTVMPMLYFLFGPPLDFMYVVAISSGVLAHMSRRLDRSMAQEKWSWM